MGGALPSLEKPRSLVLRLLEEHHLKVKRTERSAGPSTSSAYKAQEWPSL